MSGVIGRPRSRGTRVVEKQAFTVRLDADLYLKVRDYAQSERRTVGAQIELDLEKLYKRRTVA